MTLLRDTLKDHISIQVHPYRTFQGGKEQGGVFEQTSGETMGV